MAKVLKVSESGYYKWARHLNAPPTNREKEEIELTRIIHTLFWKYHGIFGSRKITRLLNGIYHKPVNHKRVERIMSENGMRSKVGRKYICTTDSNHDEPIAKNLLERDFTVTEPNQKFVSDTTEKTTKQGKIYIAAILDLYGRMPVGLALSRRNDTQLVMSALRDMVGRGCGKKGSILHSDRGSTYASKEYRKELEKHQFICSMSRKGDCWDNAPMECFWGKMKEEWLDQPYDTIEELKKDVYEYVWGFYPRQRPHASNNYITPAEYYAKGKVVV